MDKRDGSMSAEEKDMSEPRSSLFDALDSRQSSDLLPALFVGHGNPMNAIQDTSFSTTWDALGARLPRPMAILCISAHWLTPGEIRVSTAAHPETVHDFSGFPYQLFEQRYPVPGSPGVARQVMELLAERKLIADDRRGLDHGAWSVLMRLFPEADIPVLQLSLDYRMTPSEHYRLARELKPLREKGVMIIGSGNLVHNLRAMRKDGPTYDWAIAFDEKMTAFMDRGDDQAVVDFQTLGAVAKQAHPTWDHFLPVVYTLALRDATDRVHHFNRGFDLASISMRSFVLMC
jgi:4,5-DOPA dioxygenase extradiol